MKVDRGHWLKILNSSIMTMTLDEYLPARGLGLQPEQARNDGVNVASKCSDESNASANLALLLQRWLQEFENQPLLVPNNEKVP